MRRFKRSERLFVFVNFLPLKGFGHARTTERLYKYCKMRIVEGTPRVHAAVGDSHIIGFCLIFSTPQ